MVVVWDGGGRRGRGGGRGEEEGRKEEGEEEGRKEEGEEERRGRGLDTRLKDF